MVYNIHKGGVTVKLSIGPSPQTVTVTDHTFETIQHDISFFSSEACTLNQNKLLNLIIQNLGGFSDADFSFAFYTGSKRRNGEDSLEKAIREYYKKVSKEICGIAKEIIKNASDDKIQLLQKRINDLSAKQSKEVFETIYKEDFYAQKNKPMHGKQVRFTLTNKSIEKLMKTQGVPLHKLLGEKDNNEYDNKTSYKTLVKYLGRLFEAYANLSINKREKVLFKHVYEQIEFSVQNKRCLSVTIDTPEGFKQLIIKPYDILLDNATGYNYLIGLSSFNPESDSFSPATFRINRLYNLSEYNQADSLNYNEVAIIQARLRKVSPAYFSTEAVDIKVLLNSSGLRKLNIILHGRPNITKSCSLENGWYELTFFCTEFQAQTYFFKFGADAIITEPKSLKQKMQELFIQAAEEYKQ